jgi:hypothetical protein
MPRRRVKRLSTSPETATPMAAAPDQWALKIVIEEDEELSSRRFTVWLAPAGDSGLHLCIGSGPTRAAATADAEVELRGALGLLGKDAEPPACEKCGYRP